jgi:hypothetical protein
LDPAQVPFFLLAQTFVQLAQKVVRPLLYIFSDRLALDFLFGGAVKSGHTTKFAVGKYVERYAESIDNLNRAIVVSVAFVPIALLPAATALKIPLIDLEVTRQNWLRVCPAISYGLQMFTLVSLSWFLLLRRGLDVLKKEIGEVEHFGDVSNTMLTGAVGSLWLFVAIFKHFPSKLHLLWFAPLGLLALLVVFSPSALCAYFVRELFVLADWVPAIVYSVLLIPSFALAVVLIGLSVVAAMREALP